LNRWINISLVILLTVSATAANLSVTIADPAAKAERLLPVVTQLFNSLAGDSIEAVVKLEKPEMPITSFGKPPLEVMVQSLRQLMPGRQVISLLCTDANGHKSVRYLSVEATLTGKVAIPSDLLKRGEKITSEKINIQKIELNSSLLRSAVLHPERIIGMEVVRHLPGGSPIRWDQVKPRSLVQKGDEVELVIDHQAFAIKADAKALEAGALGDEIWVRLENNGKRMRAVVVDADHVTLE